MKWLSQYNRISHGYNHELFMSDRTGHKIFLKKTKIQSGVTEVNVLKTLRGNAFPRLLDYKISNDEMHIALQYIEGNTLDRLNTINLCPFTANQIVLNALSSLEEIHSKGFIHCDIKPQNMIFDTHFQVYIIDFGTAQSVRHRRVGNEWRGSVEFMPPEALYTPDSIDCRSDYYSLGKSIEKSMDHMPEILSYNAIEGLKSLCAIIPNERPSDLSELIKSLKY